jgi:hypothetical protein
MSFSFSSLVRLLVLMAVCSTMLAVGLSRLSPARPLSRASRSVKHANINEFFLKNVADRTPYWLDVETGLIAASPLEDGDVLESASCSPWIDEKNQQQVAGRWSTRTKAGPMSMSTDFGIARYAFPSGQMLDHVSTENVPIGAPCWYPGTQARILFSAGDGFLYHYAFEPEPWEKTANPQAGRDLNPRQIEWRCPKPGEGTIFFGDLTWPEDPRMSGCLVAALREQVTGEKGVPTYSRTSLWWLKLNFAGTEIVDLGRLLIHTEPNELDMTFDHRTPTIGALPDGRLVLAYLRQQVGCVGWEVRMVPIEFDAAHNVPRAWESKSVQLASKCQPAQPTFTSSGHFLNVIAGHEPRESRVARLPLDGLFRQSK